MKAAVLFVSASLLVLSFGLAEYARAEEDQDAKGGLFYIALFGGLAYPEDIRKVTSQPFGTPLADIKVAAITLKDPDFIYGGKVGFIPEEEYTWIGVEGEFFVTQTNLLSGAGSVRTGSLEVRALSMNFLLRYPRSWIQPYIGAGPSLVQADSFQLDGRSNGETAIGLNLLVGVRVSMADRVMLFAEYKHNRVDLEFGRVSIKYALNAAVGGVGIMF